jgi:glycosyltransferase involved in cell wall biosynthesis
MKILHMTTLHPAQDVRILLKECRTLARNGYDVALAARVPTKTTVEGVPVVPIGTTEVRTGLPSLARRLFRAWRAARRARARVYHLHDPELIPVGLLLKLGGACVAYDAHENTPLDATSLGDASRQARNVARVWRTAERLAGAGFDAVVAATPDIRRSFPPSKTIVARNYPLADETVAFAGPRQRERPRTVIYLGRISVDRGIRRMLAAAELADVTLVVAGPVQLGLLDELRVDPAWGRVDYRPWLSREEVAAQLRAARAGLLVLEPRKAYLESLPVKLFEYMAAGIPVIASDFLLWREIVAGAECGLLVDPASPQSIASAVEWVLAHPEEADAMGSRGRAAVQERYNWEQESRDLLALYARLSRD